MSVPSQAIRVYSFELSGHAHRVRLMLSLLGLPHEVIEVDLAGGEQKRPEFLAHNVFGQVPVIEDGGLTLADSNAILTYLAQQYDEQRRWWPADAAEQAQVQRWLSVAAGALAFGPAAARIAVVFQKTDNPQSRVIAERLFGTMEQHLSSRSWLAADHPTVADVAMYSYTAHAPEGGVLLEPFPHLRAWLARVEALPRFVGMPRTETATAMPA
ncbi:MAG TPA: glutathione S-transferase [Burkholderiaceae bacterium]|jgi:glutathione S-transferase